MPYAFSQPILLIYRKYKCVMINLIEILFI